MNGFGRWASAFALSLAVWARSGQIARAQKDEAPPGYRIEWMYVPLPPETFKRPVIKTVRDWLGFMHTVNAFQPYTVIRMKPVPIYVPIGEPKKEDGNESVLQMVGSARALARRHARDREPGTRS